MRSDFQAPVGDVEDGEPLIHHLSWARPAEEVAVKVATFGHRHDDDFLWGDWVEEVWSQSTDSIVQGSKSVSDAEQQPEQAPDQGRQWVRVTPPEFISKHVIM